MSNKLVINELNEIRKLMGLDIISEDTILRNEINEILEEGAWENVKYALSKLGRYKAGGKIFGKSQTDAKQLAKISALLDKKGNEVIKNLDRAIKQKNPEFPNNKSQEDFLNTILEIATVYDSLVAATKLKPNDEGYLPIDAANAILEDLRVYTQKYLDVDLTAAFSVFNEQEVKVKGLEDKDPNDIKVLDYGDPHKTKPGYADKPMPKGTGFANESLDEANKELKGQVKGKFADTKSAVKKGDLEAYGTERMKTLKSWRLPAALFGAGASFGALSWLIHYIFPPEKITTMTPEQIKQFSQDVLGNIEPGEGMTQILNRTLGLNLSPSSDPNDIVKALEKLGGGDATKGVDIITQQGGIFKDPMAAKQTLSAIVSNPTEHGSTLKQVFSGTWAGTGKSAGDTLVTVTGGNLTGMVVKAITTWTTKTTVIQSAKAVIAAPILKGLGVILAAGAVAAALARYKGRKSSRAQILNDLVQYIRPIKASEENQAVIGDDEKGFATDGNTGTDKDGANTKTTNTKSTEDKTTYNYLKKYFQDIFNFSSQVDTSTYGAGGSSNVRKQYGTGGGKVKDNMVKDDDIDDITKLMEGDLRLFETLKSLDILLEADNKYKDLEGIGLSSNELKLFKTHITRLSQLIKVFKGFKTDDKNLEKLVNQIKSNPIFKDELDINKLLSSDPKSLKIFVSNFNKAVYSTQFKNGNNIIDQLKKIGVNKLNEVSERTPGKSQANAVINMRREFLKNLPDLIKNFYAVFSYLIDQSRGGAVKTKQGGSQSGGSQTTSTQSGGSQSGGSQTTSTQSGGSQSGNKNFSWDWDTNDKSTWVRTEDYQLMEMVETHDNLIKIIESNILEKLTPQMDDAKKDAVKNSDSGRIFTQLSKVVPELSQKIANEYKSSYGQAINRIKLGDFLQTILGSLANLPQQKMIQIINRADMDVSAYRRMLRAIKTPDEGKDTVDTPEDGKSDEKGVKSKEKNVGAEKQENQPELNQNQPEKFYPNSVGDYDLTKMNKTFRTALAQKSADIISRNTDVEMSSENMMGVMKLLLNRIVKSGKSIPKI